MHAPFVDVVTVKPHTVMAPIPKHCPKCQPLPMPVFMFQVEDPLLAQHLSHWGINMMSMSKTEKTMTELQIDLNMSFEYDKITEAGSELTPLSGAGLVDQV
jgi:hypothetical protein